MFRSLQFLASGSKGNAAILSTREARILIEVGLSGRQLLKCLAYYHLSIHDIDAVFITHEHSDHAQGVRGLKAFPHLLFFANPATICALEAKYPSRIAWQCFDTGDVFRFRDIEVSTYAIPHDAEDPVAYRFTSTVTSQHQVAWIMDLGYIPQSLTSSIQTAQVLVLEANFDPELLLMDIVRPQFVKERIRGRYGHLSNAASIHAICQHLPIQAEKVFLTHLSQDCNSPEILNNLLALARKEYPEFPLDVDLVPHGSALGKEYFFTTTS